MQKHHYGHLSVFKMQLTWLEDKLVQLMQKDELE